MDATLNVRKRSREARGGGLSNEALDPVVAPSGPERRRAPPKEPTGFLEANDAAYRSLLRRLRQVDAHRHPEAALEAVERVARLACTWHAGRFTDGAVENVARTVGLQAVAASGTETVRLFASPRRRVLHVATQVTPIGGHTRMIEHWARGDRDAAHALVLTAQGATPIPSSLEAALAAAGGGIVRLPEGESRLARAGMLRRLASTHADLVVLHHYAFDAVPVAAFAPHGGPPVAILNHADHLFWLGSSVADAVISLRSAGASHAAERRFSPCDVVLPIPLAPQVPAARDDARRALGIPADRQVLVSVGRGEKYRPSGRFDFVASANRLLERLPGAHLYVVGETATGIAPWLRVSPHERLHFVGPTRHPAPWRAAADLYLESFPFGSQTALLEAGLDGLPVVPAWAPLFPLLVANDDSLVDVLPNPVDEEAWLDRAASLLRDADLRSELGLLLQRRLEADHLGAGWERRLGELYLHLDRLRHEGRALPDEPCSTDAADVRLSLWQLLSPPDAGELAVALHAGQVARIAGAHAAAVAHAGNALLQVPTSHHAWRLLAAGLLGDRARSARRLLRL